VRGLLTLIPDPRPHDPDGTLNLSPSQIMSCNKCSAHLGWKFQINSKGLHGAKDEEEPKMMCDGKTETVRSHNYALSLRAASDNLSQVPRR
jgi:hypothetical protein